MGRMERHQEYREKIKKGTTQEKTSQFRKIKSKKNVEETYAPNEENFERREIGSFGKKNKKDKKIKKKKGKVARIIRNILLVILVIILVIVGRFVWSYYQSAKSADRPKEEIFNGEVADNGAHNILILGTDQRTNQSSAESRSDSIMVLQLDGPSKKPKLISFMRDTLVSIPNFSSGDQQDAKINLAYTLGEQGTAGEDNQNQGADLVRETLENNFGIKTKYYMMVNFNSFASVIDALFPNGLEIDAKFATINGQTYESVPVPDDLASTEGMVASDKSLTAEEASQYGYSDPAIYMFIKQGKQKMDGRTLLNYARFRHDDEYDFGRVKRQQQVMNAIIEQSKTPSMLLNAPSAAGKVFAQTSTNIPDSFLAMRVLSILISGNTSVEKLTVPDGDNYSTGYDRYGGSGLLVDRSVYKTKIANFLN